MAGRGDLDLHAQAAGLHRPLRLVSEILLANARAVLEYAVEEKSALRFRLSIDYARSLDGGFRERRLQAGSAPAHLEGECSQLVRFEQTEHYAGCAVNMAVRATTRVREVHVAASETIVERRPDGTIRMRSPRRLGLYPVRLTERLEQWAERTPERTFLAQRGPDGAWREITY